jgi:peptidoglycan/xylan/chitin deacetylase (PgdA/CDA1 family)
VFDALIKNNFSILPPKPLLITIDDGHIDNALLLGIIKKYNLPAVIYVVAGIIGTKRGFWFDKLSHHSQEMKILKNMSDAERRSWMEHHYKHKDELEYDTPSALSIEQLKDFIAVGCTIGSHTMFHPMLTRCDDKIGFSECVESRNFLENALGVPVKHFALPNGNMDIRVKDWLNKAGYLTCRSITPGFLVEDGDALSLPCFGISDNAGSNKALLQASGLWNIFKRIVGK